MVREGFTEKVEFFLKLCGHALVDEIIALCALFTCISKPLLYQSDCFRSRGILWVFSPPRNGDWEYLESRAFLVSREFLFISYFDNCMDIHHWWNEELFNYIPGGLKVCATCHQGCSFCFWPGCIEAFIPSYLPLLMWNVTQWHM